MFDEDHIAVTAFEAGEDHLSSLGRPDGLAPYTAEIDAIVLADHAEDRVFTEPKRRGQPTFNRHDEPLSRLLGQVSRRLPELLCDQVVNKDGHQVFLSFEVPDLAFVCGDPFLKFALDVLFGGDSTIQDTYRRLQFPLACLSVGDSVVGRQGDVLEVGLHGPESIH